jgi:2,4-dienoyl-CoA reductase-like NADH-dependent reductase (Old Yellow Enzyme family)/thioredoxin reductase
MSLLDIIFSPIRIKDLELQNRAVMAPMGTSLGNEDGTVSDALIAYIRRRAIGKPGLIITGVAAVHPTGPSIKNQVGVYDDKFIPGLRRLAGAIHDFSGKAALQLHHAGRESFHLLKKGSAIAPSAIPSLVFGMTPKEMTKEDISEIIRAFGAAALRAKQAGFDAVEIHGAHGYLLGQFLSSLSNTRKDEYGGDLHGRKRFTLDVVSEVRKQVGDSFPVSIRISAEEFIKGGYTVSDILPILPDVVKVGADIIHVSIGTHGSPGSITTAPAEYKPGFNAWRAAKFKEVVNVPVIAVGRFSDPLLAAQIVHEGKADLVSFGRQFLADPDFLIKTKEGRIEDVRKCIACNQGCIERLLFERKKIRCAINPETGQENIYPHTKAKAPKKVWIVGGGPAGLIAAYESARIGHSVELFEKDDTTGGQIRYACVPPYKGLYGEWISWLTDKIRELGVQIHLGAQVTDNTIRDEHPSILISAIGAEQIIPNIPGINLPHVCNALDILGRKVKLKKNIVIIGGGLIGMEVGDYAATKKCNITIVEILEKSPVSKASSRGYFLYRRLKDAKCTFLFGSKIASIEANSAIVQTNRKNWKMDPVDQVIIAAGMKRRINFEKTLEEENIRHFIVGDAVEPRRIIEATEEGAKAAWSI